MASVSKIGGLITGTAGKIESISAAVGGIMCLPQLVIEELGALVNQSIATLLAIPGAMASALLGVVNGIIDNVIGTVVGAIKKLIGALQGILDAVLQGIQNIKNFVNKVKDNLFSKDNCNFNAASLLKCITSSVASNVSKSDVSKITNGITSITDKATEISNKIAAPGAVLAKYLDKASNNISRATGAIQAVTRF